MSVAEQSLSSAAPAGGMRWPFVLTIFAGSFLLFMVQPMVARMALPELGGAPAVWNSAMLVYQALLLGGYAYAHWLGRFSIRQQTIAHIILLLVAALTLPVALRDLAPPSDDSVALFVPWLLLASVGPILFAVSAQAPLIQRWFGVAAPGVNPYALYAASNLGSFGGLIAYPLVVEPALSLRLQSIGWSVGYGVLVLLVMLCAMAAMRARRIEPGSAATQTIPATPRPTMRTLLLWGMLSAVPSGLMLSTTTHLTTDIMAMPLLWAIPLGLYLLSFSVAFSDRNRLADIATLLAPPVIILAAGLVMETVQQRAIMVAIISVTMLFVVAIALHRRLYSLRPAIDHLTLFYLVMAMGGVLGGLFAALIAPLAFDWVYEHPILLIAAACLLPMPDTMPFARLFGSGRGGILAADAALALVLGLGALLILRTGLPDQWHIGLMIILFLGAIFVIGSRWRFLIALVMILLAGGGAETLKMSATDLRTRSYFGVYTVRDGGPSVRWLAHGTTLHGTQLLDPQRRTQATSYYGPTSGVGLAFNAAQQLYGADASLAVVGLGTGTLACYRKAEEQFQFYEIDPVMVHIARDSGYFHFMPTCAKDVPIHIGDARVRLRETPAASIDLLAVDAFSSDAIPLHLMTREAFDVYARALRPDGVALVHISNRYLTLEPVLAALRQAGWYAMMRDDWRPSDDDSGLTSSMWVAMSRNPAALRKLVDATTNQQTNIVWRPLQPDPKVMMWTDDYASVLPVMDFHRAFQFADE